MALKKSDDKSTKNAPLGKDSRAATGLVGVHKHPHQSPYVP